jgi:ABC-2 type transport system ATP-binding protein
MESVLEAHGLGKAYRGRSALVECELSIPTGSVVGLVGPNGAGKTTLLHLATGVIKPTTGSIKVVGASPGADRGQLANVGFVAQDTPTYANMSIGDHLKLGAHLNPRWDADFARWRIEGLGLDFKHKAGRLSGGQRAQLALTMAIAKRPALLILDEPVAALDPLARREFFEALVDAVAAHRMSVVLSSHLVSDLELACNYLIVLANGRIQLAGETDRLIAEHRFLAGPQAATPPSPVGSEMISVRRADRCTTVVVRGGDGSEHDPEWTASPVTLEELVLAYMNRAAASRGARTEQEVVK